MQTSRQACNGNIAVFLKTCFSHKTASATKRFRNTGSFKLDRFMPLSQPTYRKKYLLHFELRGCIVSKNKKEKSPHMLEICLWCHLILLNSHLNLEAFTLHVNAFTHDLLCEKLSRTFLESLALRSSTGKPSSEGDQTERSLALKLWVLILLGAALCEMTDQCHFAMCNHHHCHCLQNSRTNRANCGHQSASQQMPELNTEPPLSF